MSIKEDMVFMQADALANALSNIPVDMSVAGQSAVDMRMAAQAEEVKMPIGDEEVAKALATLQKYKDDKASLERRIVSNEQWYKSRHWDEMRGMYNQGDKKNEQRPEPTSAWLFNSIANKHADIMDNIPMPAILPREPFDQADADTLSEVVPVILERNHFEDTYSHAAWYKLKNGVSITGVFWDSKAENGLGDIQLKKLDVLNVFWEHGISDIQESKNLFIVKLIDNDVAQQRYPQLKDRDMGKAVEVAKYVLDDDVDTSDKTLVVDWYYKKAAGTKTVLHFAKIVGDELVYATENDVIRHNPQEPSMAERGWYDHGLYPVVFDVLYPEEGTPTGFGYVDIMRSPQMYIDKLDQLVLENTMRNAKTRYFARGDGTVDMDEFADLSKEIVTVNGNDIDRYVKKIETSQIDLQILGYVQYKVDELKETSGNRDVNQGSSSGGVTAAAAISALQEAGNKLSRDFINASYRQYAKVIELVIELIRQFYDVSRNFRIEGPNGMYRFIQYSNAKLKMQGMMLPDGSQGGRKPIFDIKVSAQRKSPFSTLTQNELAKELYGAGFFNPQMAVQALPAIELMEFEGKDKVKEKIQQNYRQFMQQQYMAMQMQAAVNGAVQVPQQPAVEKQAVTEQGGSIPADNGIAGAVTNANTSYAQQMAKRAQRRVEG